MKILVASLLAASMLVTSSAFAQRKLVEIIDYKNQSWPDSGGKKADMEKVKQNIVKVVQSQKGDGYPWIVEKASDGNIEAMLFVRGKHTMRVAISYTENQFSVVYLNSTNMNASKDGAGKDIIHPFYNRWVGELVKTIRSQAAQP